MSENTENTPATENTGSKSIVLDQGRGGLFGIKAGMTQVYTADGALVAVTVIDLRPNVVTQVAAPELVARAAGTVRVTVGR